MSHFLLDKAKQPRLSFVMYFFYEPVAILNNFLRDLSEDKLIIVLQIVSHDLYSCKHQDISILLQ